MQVTVNKEIEVSIKELAEKMTYEELAYLLTECSHRFDKAHKERKKLAVAFTEGMSETGCRFLAEIVATHYFRS